MTQIPKAVGSSAACCLWICLYSNNVTGSLSYNYQHPLHTTLKKEVFPFTTTLKRITYWKKIYAYLGKLRKSLCIILIKNTQNKTLLCTRVFVYLFVSFSFFVCLFYIKNQVCQLTKSVDWKVPGRHNQQCSLLCCFQYIVQPARLSQQSLNHLTLLSDWMSNLCKFKEKRTLMFMLQHLLLSSTQVILSGRENVLSLTTITKSTTVFLTIQLM